MLGIRLEPELDARLDRLAKETGRTKSYYAKQAIKQFLEDRERTICSALRLSNAMNREPSSPTSGKNLVWSVELTESTRRQLRKLDKRWQSKIFGD